MTCLRLDSVSAFDVAFNGNDFSYNDDTDTCELTMWRRVNGVAYGPKPNDWDCIASWDNNGELIIDGFQYTETALQLTRFVIIDGEKNPASFDNPAWDVPASAWNILGEGANGETMLFTVQEPGLTLHQAVDKILEMGVDILYAGDLDSGRSTKVKVGADMWQSTNDAVANFVGIMLKESESMASYTVVNKTPFYRWRQNTIKAKDGALSPGFDLDGTPNGEWLIVSYALPGGNNPPYAVALADLKDNTEPEPEPPPGEVTLKHTIKVFSDGSITIDGNAYP